MIVVGAHVIPDGDLTWRFSRSSGPGGQHVNTTDSRVQLSYDLLGSDAFPDPTKERLVARLGAEVTVSASEHRSQHLNRRAAEEKLVERLQQALAPPPARRRPTKPTRGSQRRRLEGKKRRGETKRLRGRPGAE